MIKLTRKRTKGIPKNFRGQDRIDKVLELLKFQRSVVQSGNTMKHEFPSNWSPCKKQLHKESSNKCAYCEAPTTMIAYGDVEHYRPKSQYWWLAYCYDNYLASCTLCNQKYKKAKFSILNQKIPEPQVLATATDNELLNIASRITPDPFEENLGRDYGSYEQEHFDERPFLLNPYLDDPAHFFAWEVDHVKKYVTMVPLDPQNNLHVRMVQAAEEDMGLNRKELLTHRYYKYVDYTEARLISEDDEVPNSWRDRKRQKMQEIMQPERSFLGMLRYFEAKTSDELSLPG